MFLSFLVRMFSMKLLASCLIIFLPTGQEPCNQDSAGHGQPTREEMVSEQAPLDYPAPYPTQLAAAATQCPCTVSQDAFSMTLPFFSNNESAVSFYSYSNPLGSCANTGFEQSNHLILMLYEDTNTGEISFIFVADLPNDGDGGTMDVTISCLPNSAYIALMDDAGEMGGAPPTITGDFFWDQCCTDGGIIGGLGCGYSFIFDIDNLTGIDVITLLYGSPANPVYIDLPSSECPFIFNCGGDVCCANVMEVASEIQNANCANTAEGAIDIDVTGECLQQLEYEWSNGETTEDIMDLAPGTYTVTVSDVNGCSIEESFVVDAEYGDPMPMIDGPSWYCEGEAAELSVNGNYNFFDWSTGETTETIFVSQPGTYSVTVTNEGGCTGSASFTIEEYAAPVPVITGPTELCPGSTIQLDAGPGFSLYEWSSGGYNQTLDILYAGTYSVVVTNSFGCTGEASIDITELSAPEPIINGPITVCKGQVIVLEVDDIYQSYLWSNGETSPQIQVSTPGIYSVTVTDLEACPGIGVYEVFEGLIDPLILDGDTVLCQGDTTILSSAGTYQEYLWSNGAMTPQITVGNSGSFTLYVMDENGCRDTSSIQVNVVPELPVQILGQNVFCKGQSTQLTADPPYPNYLWSTGELTASITVNQPGSYWVEVRDDNGCTGRDTLPVVENPLDTTLLFISSCNLSDTGVTVLSLTNQFGCDSVVIRTVSYNLADTTFVAAASCDPLDQGVDIKTYTSQFGCDSVVVTTTALLPSDTTMAQATTCDPANAGLSFIQLSNQWGCDSIIEVLTTYVPPDTTILSSTTCDPQIADTSMVILNNQYGCDSLVVKSIQLLPSSTSAFTFYSCNPLDTGTVVQTYSNQFGCDSIVTWSTLLVPLDSCILRVVPKVQPGPCAGDPGQIVLEADLGSFPVVVNWWLQGSSMTQQGTWSSFFSPYLIPALPDGTYILDLTDADGHAWMDTITIKAPDPLLAGITSSPALNGYDLACAGDATASLMVNYQSGGTLPISIVWSNGQTGNSLNDLGAGMYQVTVSDKNGCSLVLSDTLVEPPALSGSWTIFQDPCDGQPAEVVSSSIQGGVAPIQYVLDGVVQPGQTWPLLPYGVVTLGARDANGCVVDSLITIPAESVFSVELGPNQLHEKNKLIFLLAQIIPDSVALASIQWSPELCENCLDPAFRVKETTTITVTVTSFGGCVSTDAVLIELDERNIYIPNSFSPNNDGLNDLFAPQGDPEVEVVDFAIFDRWGDEVYRSGGFHLGDPDVGWNGDARNQPASIDVYVYAMVLRWPDGQERLYKGDLQVMR
ncbi:MAG: gliding motility-associated C-terminal domain-containing protein [Saprospiraceae bacterium]